MNKFVNNLKRQAEENPIAAIAVGVAATAVASKLISAVGGAIGSAAYARSTNYRINRQNH